MSLFYYYTSILLFHLLHFTSCIEFLYYFIYYILLCISFCYYNYYYSTTIGTLGKLFFVSVDHVMDLIRETE